MGRPPSLASTKPPTKKGTPNRSIGGASVLTTAQRRTARGRTALADQALVRVGPESGLIQDDVTDFGVGACGGAVTGLETDQGVAGVDIGRGQTIRA